MQGWISLYRDLQDNFLWDDKPFSYGQAWIDILLSANAKEGDTLFDRDVVKVKKGSFITSERKLMERWGWSKSKVRFFLDLLEDKYMIDREKDSKKTTITVKNWGKYQTTDLKSGLNGVNTSKTPILESGLNGVNTLKSGSNGVTTRDSAFSESGEKTTNNNTILNNTVNYYRNTITDEDKKRFEEIDNWIDQERKNGDVFLNAIFR